MNATTKPSPTTLEALEVTTATIDDFVLATTSKRLPTNSLGLNYNLREALRKKLVEWEKEHYRERYMPELCSDAQLEALAGSYMVGSSLPELLLRMEELGLSLSSNETPVFDTFQAR
jgi:hypothetical protein